MSSKLKDLLAQRAALEKQIEDAARAERADAVAKVRALMADHGLSLADLGNRTASGKPKGASRGGGKVAAKYRDGATGSTWSGRGLRPNWLKAALAAGKKLEDFAV
jgi:DNA-binding protein H-NS